MHRLIVFIPAALMAFASVAHPATANGSDDYCAKGTFDTNNGATVVCDDDYSCDVVAVLVKSGTGECWTERGYGRHF